MKKNQFQTINSNSANNKQQRIDQQSPNKTGLEGQDGWAVSKRLRLPHKAGLPLGSGGCGDGIER